MISQTLPSFWKAYESLNDDAQKGAAKAFRLWAENPFHPSLRFKQVNAARNVWAVRISRGTRALCVRDGDVFTWYWIGSHDEYMKSIS